MLQDWIQKGYKYSQNPIFRRFTGKAGGLLAKPMKVGLLLTTAYSKMVDVNSGVSGFQQLKTLMMTFMRMARAYVRGDYRDISRKSMMIGVAVLLYLVTPLDIIPDFIPVVGLMDDISLMAWFVDAFSKEINKYREWEMHTSYENIGRF
ncbi:YkvA family protein [Pontibacter litorisediminis]|uniref:YkvA family protein n=1 Tax=Pontibacter litorisediminis TaxID=1846260 RepID=UPI0023EB9109|nr:YkvA family protein [Pontibacter litorisediminis]